MPEPRILYNEDYLVVDGSVGITRVREPSDPEHLHAHEFVEVCYVCGGSGFHTIDGTNRVRAGNGDVFVIPKGVGHCFVSTDAANPVTTYNIMFVPDFLEPAGGDYSNVELVAFANLCRRIISDDSRAPHVHLGEPARQSLDALARQVFLEAAAKQPGYVHIIRASIVEILVRVIREFTLQVKDPIRSAVQDLLDYLDAHCQEPLSLTDLSARFFLTRTYLCRLFKKNTGMTIREYMYHARIEKACRLLSSPDLRIADIAGAVGFSDYKAFSAVFRRITGKKPLEYRKGITSTPFRATPSL